MKPYLKLPLRFGSFFNKTELGHCSLKESVLRHLHLLITTAKGENRQDPGYGCRFWADEYDVHLSNDARREAVAADIRRQVQRYEKRLTGFSVEVAIRQAEWLAGGQVQWKRRIEIIIKGFLVLTGEPVHFQTGFFIGPVLFD